MIKRFGTWFVIPAVLSLIMGVCLPLLVNQLPVVLPNWHPFIFLEVVLVIAISLIPLLLRPNPVHVFTMQAGTAIWMAFLFGARPLYIMANQSAVHSVFVTRSYSYGLLSLALIYAIVGMASFHLGSVFPLGEPISKGLPVIGPIRSNRRMTVVALLTGSAFVLGTLGVLVAAGGLAQVAQNPLRVRRLLRGMHYLAAGIHLMPVGILPIVAHSLRSRFPAWPAWLLAMAYTLSRLVWGDRSGAVLLWAAILVIHLRLGRRRKRLRNAFFAALLIVVALLGFPIVREIRGSAHDVSEIGSTAISSMPRSVSSTLESVFEEFRQAEVFAMILSVTPRVQPYLYGRSYLDLLFLPIPRALWSNKPMPVGFRLGRLFYESDVGVPPSIIGEMFLNFGIYGIILGMFAFGVMCRAIDEWVRRNRYTISVIVVFAFLYVNLPRIVTRSFLGVGGLLFTFLIPAYFVLQYAASPRRRRVGSEISGSFFDSTCHSGL